VTSLAIGPAAPASAAARELLRAYFDDVASRYLGRAATACEVDAAMRDDPSDDLAVLLRGLKPSFGRCNGAGFPCDREGDERTTPCPRHRRPSSDP